MLGWNTWNAMNQGKLEVVKQEMARVNIDVLGIIKLKWTGMGEFNSDNHYIFYCGQESLRRNGVAIMVNKRVQNAVLGRRLREMNHRSLQFNDAWTWKFSLEGMGSTISFFTSPAPCMMLSAEQGLGNG